MRIGIDLDNTIICYEESFGSVARKYGYVQSNISLGKQAVKDEVLKNKNGQFNWERLQGLVYGRYLQQAKLYPNFLKFLIEAVSLGDVQIDIVSHKTVFAHHDPLKTNLRSSALKFLRDSRVFDVGAISFKNVHFTSTLDDKVAKIQALGCEIFIDDLNIVFEHYDFPETCRKILFNGISEESHGLCGWRQVSNDIFKQ